MTPASLLVGLRRHEALASVLLAVFFAVGIASHLVATLRPLMTHLTPWVLTAAGLLTVLFWDAGRPQFALLWVASTYAVTFALEALGTHTGLVFGAYTYGAGLGPKLLDVPLVIGFNWTIVVLGIHALVAGLGRPWQRVLGTAAGAVLFDWVMEPVAIDPRMDYWSWAAVEVPLQNYVAWFVIAALAAVWLEALRLRPAGAFARVFVLTQGVFFVVLQLGFGPIGLP